MAGEFLNNVAGDGMHMARAVAWEHHECPDSNNRPVRMEIGWTPMVRWRIK